MTLRVLSAFPVKAPSEFHIPKISRNSLMV
jgi:hypothetical protein